MPNIKSAWKQMRKSEASRKRNVSVKTEIKHIRREVLKQTEGAGQAGGEAAYRKYCSALDKAAKHGTIKKNTAIRRKARAAERLRLARQAAAAQPAAG